MRITICYDHNHSQILTGVVTSSSLSSPRRRGSSAKCVAERLRTIYIELLRSTLLELDPRLRGDDKLGDVTVLSTIR